MKKFDKVGYFRARLSKEAAQRRNTSDLFYALGFASRTRETCAIINYVFVYNCDLVIEMINGL